MRPIQLVISAFGPFAGEEIIDFEKLGTSGIYLVTGDTGAGKTTLFDAISYALYGAPSGEHRDSRMFRSKYAKADTKTFVELTFENRGEKYVIHRIPEYVRPKGRGEGTTLQKPEVTLFYSDDRQPVTKVQEVEQAIKEIIGLDQKQFSQITMLAQGEFRKMLLSSTDEKQDIFRDIFSTDAYGTLQVRMKNRFLEVREEYKKYSLQLLQDITRLESEEAFEGHFALEDYKEKGQLVQFECLNHWMKTLVEYDDRQLTEYEEELQRLEHCVKELDRQIGIAGEREKALLQLQEVEEKMAGNVIALTRQKVRLQEAEEQAKVCDTLSKETVRIQDKLADYKKYEMLCQSILELRQQLEKTEKEQITSKATIETCCMRERELQDLIEANEEAEKQQLICQQELARSQERSRLLEQLLEQAKEIEELLRQWEFAREEYQRVSAVCGQQEQEFLEEEKCFFDAQAGMLAKNLKRGVPCPVCGSVEHPKPAQTIAEVLTREELERKREELEREKTNREKASFQSGKREERYRESLRQWEQQVLKLCDTSEVSVEQLQRDYSQLQEDVLRQQKEYEQLEQSKQLYIRAKKELPQTGERKRALEEQYQKAEHLRIEMQTELLHFEKQKESMAKELPFESEEGARIELQRLQEQIQRLQSEKDITGKTLQEMEKEQKELEGQKKSLKGQLEEDSVKQKAELLKERSALEQQQAKRKNHYNVLQVRYQKNRQLVADILQKWHRFEELEQAYSATKELSDTMNGELPGRDKVKLETYIQMAYFDRVLAKANIRLLKMTGGQYELVRSEQARNQRSQTGLDLDIYDYYTMAQRSVKTLSGGETFMASLALALGLADEIQEAAGGVRVDTLFVDEGFGSLDDDTLHRAMKELNRLTDGNRLVGIISHVTELQNWIDKQIVVTKQSHQGSSVEIVL